MSNALTSRLKKKKKGFTLIELIIVIAIIAILAAIAIPSFTKIRDNSKLKSDQASEDTIRKQVITLLTDGTIKKGTSDGIITISKSASGTVSATVSGTFGTGSATDLAGYFKDVNNPQQDNMTKYIVTVTNTEDVTVTATP